MGTQKKLAIHRVGKALRASPGTSQYDLDTISRRLDNSSVYTSLLERQVDRVKRERVEIAENRIIIQHQGAVFNAHNRHHDPDVFPNLIAVRVHKSRLEAKEALKMGSVVRQEWDQVFNPAYGNSVRNIVPNVVQHSPSHRDQDGSGSLKGMVQIEAGEHGCFTEVGISGYTSWKQKSATYFQLWRVNSGIQLLHVQSADIMMFTVHNRAVECTFQHKGPALPMMKLGACLMDPRRRSQYPWLDRPRVDSAGQDIHFDPSLQGPRLNARRL
ncbi:hypothetical protein C8J57DRAFT_1251372 [Mycena rebaudengoi]|nr:hypothetical protein C8J57DRAFT_1251372 [Mycena rebaudengoi]